MAAGYFLLLAQEKVTKDKGTLGAAPAAERPVREDRPGSSDAPSLARSRMRAIHRAHRVPEHAAFSSDLRRGTEGFWKSCGAKRVFAYVGAAIAAIFRETVAAIAAPTKSTTLSLFAPGPL
jgi:hypothetical protein